MSKMKVFRLNEIDYVAAKSFEDAKQWYMDYYEFDEDEAIDPAYYPYEINPKEVMMWYEVDEIPLEEQDVTRKMKMIDGIMFALVTIDDVLNWENKDDPYIICSTEI
jgi:hypothetical protein